MDIMMGLLAAVMWGATDFLIGLNARSVGVRKAVFFGQVVGLALMLIILLLSGSEWGRLMSASARSLSSGVVASLLALLGALALSKAFSVGHTAVVAPLVTSYGLFTTLLAWLGGEQISAMQVVGILVCFGGVILVGIHSSVGDVDRRVKHAQSVGFALSAAMFYGISFWIQGKFALPELGPINMLTLTYATGTLFLIPELLKFTREYSSLTVKAFLGLCGASLLNLGGFSAFSWGVASGSLAVVTVISTLSGGVAATLGYMFRKERLLPIQIVGVGLVLVGVVMLHLVG